MSKRVPTHHALFLQLNEEATMLPSSRQDAAKPYETQHTERRDQKLRIWRDFGVHFQRTVGDQRNGKYQILADCSVLKVQLPEFYQVGCWKYCSLAAQCCLPDLWDPILRARAPQQARIICPR